MSGKEQSATFEAGNPSDQKFELGGQYPGQVKFSGPPRRRSVRPEPASNVEQGILPGLQTSNYQDETA